MRSDNAGASDEAKLESEAAEKTIKNLLLETHSTEESFLKSTRTLVAYIKSDRAALVQRLKPKEIEALDATVALYNDLAKTNNLFANFPKDDATTNAERVNFTNSVFEGEKFKNHLKLMHDVSLKYKAFDNLIKLLASSSRIKADPIIKQHLYEMSGLAITPAQRWPRYVLLVEQFIKFQKRVIGADPKSVESLQSNFDNIRQQNLIANTEILRTDANVMINQHLENLKKDKKNNPEIRKLQALARVVNSSQDRESLTRALMQFYVNSYQDYRSRGLTVSLSGVGYGTKKATFLQDMEESLIKAFDIHKPADQNNEDALLEAIAATPKSNMASIRNSIINNLFARAMAEGVVGNDQLAFVNAVKQIVKMRPGTGAMEEWNKLAAGFSNGATVTMAKPDLSEGEIRKMFDDGIKNNVALRTEMKDNFVSDVLISHLSKDRPKGLDAEDLDDLDDLLMRIEAVKADPRKVHHELMQLYSQEFSEAKLKNRKDSFSNPLLVYLESAMKESGITTKLNASNPNADLTRLVQDIYLDSYLEGRNKSAMGSVSRTPYLQQLETAIVKAFNLPQGQKDEEMILQHAALTDEARKSMVETLYRRAMSEGIAQKDKMIYVNAGKLVAEMGDKAIGDWNALVDSTLGDPEQHLPLNTKNDKGQIVPVSGDELGASYNKLQKTEHAVNNVKKLFSPQILINILKAVEIPKDYLSKSQYHFLNSLIKQLEAVKGNYRDFHNNFMSGYMDAYISERKDRGNLVKLLETAIGDFNEITKSNKPSDRLFYGVEAKRGVLTKVQINQEIFGSMANQKFSLGDDRAALAELAFTRASEALEKASALPAGDGRRNDYINTAVMAAKAVFKMTSAELTEGLDHWDKLARLGSDKIDPSPGMSIRQLWEHGQTKSSAIKKVFGEAVEQLSEARKEYSRSSSPEASPRGSVSAPAAGASKAGFFGHAESNANRQRQDKQPLQEDASAANKVEADVPKTSIRVGNK